MQTPFWLCLFGLALLSGVWGRADDQPDPVDAKEIRECRRNLHLIYEAIQAFRRVHQDFPNDLAELQPRFLSDGRYLICPAARRFGLTSTDLIQWGPSSRTTYDYGFVRRPVPRIISGGSERTMREWKELQMGLIGSEVPILRCHTHERSALNLSFGGRIYESATTDWEQGFAEVVDPLDLSKARCLARYAIEKRIVIPSRDPQALPQFVDLSNVYNFTFDETWPGHEPLRPLANLSSGLVRFNSVLFDVRAGIQLRAFRAGVIQYPPAVTNIMIGLPGQRVQLLVGSLYAVAPETSVAQFVFHLADGRQQRFELKYGVHLAASVTRAGENSPAPALGAIAWSSEIKNGWIARLYQCNWINPFPDQIIQRLDFVAKERDSGPFLIAVTVHQEL